MNVLKRRELIPELIDSRVDEQRISECYKGIKINEGLPVGGGGFLDLIMFHGHIFVLVFVVD